MPRVLLYILVFQVLNTSNYFILLQQIIKNHPLSIKKVAILNQ